jgi:AcrR family transcriptional regulator
LSIATSPRKRPRQARAVATVEAILQATAHILVESGYSKLNTNEVAHRAGASVGSLYQYFPNKESLLAELHHRHVLQTTAPIFAALCHSEGKPLRTVLREIIRANVASHSLDPQLHQVLSEEAPKLPKRAWQRELADEATQLVRRFLQEHEAQLAVTPSDLTIYLLTQIVETTVHSAVNLAPQALKNGSLAKALERMLFLYLTSDSEGRKRQPARA